MKLVDCLVLKDFGEAARVVKSAKAKLTNINFDISKLKKTIKLPNNQFSNYLELLQSVSSHRNKVSGYQRLETRR